MATANELFHDAIVRRQIALQRYSATLGRQIIGLLDSTEADIRKQLNARLADMVDAGVDHGPYVTARLNVLEASIRDIRAGVINGDITTELTDQLQALGGAEAEFINDAFNDYSPFPVDLALPTAEGIASIVTEQPFQGRVLGDWAESMADSDVQRIMDAVRVGLTQGDTNDAITRRVLGTGALSGADGATETTRRNAMAITRTAVASVSNGTRSDTYEANSDVFSKEQYVATLDSHTTPECQALDGQQFPVGEGPQPPIHWQCRSVRVAVIDPKGLIGFRPEDSTMSDEELRSSVGYVPAKTTYQDFIARQSDAFQDEVLGPTRAALLRDGGLTVQQFVNRDLRPLTIDELRTKEPAAFRRAGLDD